GPVRATCRSSPCPRRRAGIVLHLHGDRKVVCLVAVAGGPRAPGNRATGLPAHRTPGVRERLDGAGARHAGAAGAALLPGTADRRLGPDAVRLARRLAAAEVALLQQLRRSGDSGRPPLAGRERWW